MTKQACHACLGRGVVLNTNIHSYRYDEPETCHECHGSGRLQNPAAVALGRLGGVARAKAISKARRLEIASKAGKLGGWPKGKLRGPRKPKSPA